MTFIDFKEYLQDKLDGIQSGFSVSNERKLKSNFIDKEVVVTALAGTIYDDSATIPYQITITTLDPENAQNVFTRLAKENNNKSFTSIVQEEGEEEAKMYSIVPIFQTPVVMDADIEVGSNHYARLVAFVNLTIWFDVSNVKKITIDNEEINFLNGSFGYTAELMSNRLSGQKLNKSTKKSSTAMLTFQAVNRNTNFYKNVFKTMVGERDTYFTVTIELTNNQTATMKMIIGTNTISFARSSLSSNNITLYLYDDRN